MSVTHNRNLHTLQLDRTPTVPFRLFTQETQNETESDCMYIISERNRNSSGVSVPTNFFAKVSVLTYRSRRVIVRLVIGNLKQLTVLIVKQLHGRCLCGGKQMVGLRCRRQNFMSAGIFFL